MPARGHDPATARRLGSSDAEEDRTMDMPRYEVRTLRFDQYSTAKYLEHASEQARKRNYNDFRITTKTNPTRTCSPTSTAR
jgi:hypothetical protein